MSNDGDLLQILKKQDSKQSIINIINSVKSLDEGDSSFENEKIEKKG